MLLKNANKKVSTVKSVEPAITRRRGNLLNPLRHTKPKQHKQINGPYTLYNTDFIVKTIHLKR